MSTPVPDTLSPAPATQLLAFQECGSLFDLIICWAFHGGGRILSLGLEDGCEFYLRVEKEGGGQSG